MNENTQSAAAGESAGEQASDPSPEGQSTAAGKTGTGTGFLARLFGSARQKNGSNLREDLEDALAEKDADGDAFSPGERAMLNNILRLRELRVEDVMIPRAEIEAVETTTTLGELLVRFEQSGNSRMPVYEDTLDDARGMVHIRDFLAHITKVARKRARPRKPPAASGDAPDATTMPAPAPVAAGAQFDLSRVDLTRTIGEAGIMRSLLFVPPSMLASDLMARMQAGRIQMALVIDEYGGTDGLVSLEDIVEMVVGNIEDEHDEEEPLITKAGEGVYIVDARAEIDDVAAMIGNGFSGGDHAEDVDTIGGMIFNALGRIPMRGEVVQAIPGYEFHVLDADPRRVKRVRIVQGRAGDRRRRVSARRDDKLGEAAE